MLHLSILPELALREVVLAVHAYGLEAVRMQLKDCRTVYIALGTGKHSLHVRHYRLQILALMQEHTVPVGNLVFPVLLPFAQSTLFQQAVGFDNQLRSGCLKSHTPLDTYDRVSHVAVTAYRISRAYLLYLLNSLDLVIETLSVHRHDLAFPEANLQYGFLGLGNVLQIRLLGKPLCRVQYLPSADTGSPDTYIVRIFQFGEVRMEAMLVQEIHLFLAGKSLVTGQSNDFNARSHHQKSHVKANLVVPRTRTSMGDGICANLLGVARNGYRLKYAFRGNGDGITVVAQHISEYHVFQTLLVIFMGDIERHISLCAQLVGILLVLFQLLFRETARIGTGCIHIVTFFLCQIHNRIGGVQATAICHNYFLCHNKSFIS